jgi:hypothetical protein
MKLPDYFLADLPPEATLTPTMLREACLTLKRNRASYLAGRSTHGLVNLLSGVAQDWLQPDNPFRKLALERGPAALGFSRATLANGLDAFFGELTGENLHALLVQELGRANRLDEMTANASERRASRLALARGPEFLGHFAAGNIPVPAMMSLVLGVLVRSAQFLKCASGTSLLPRLFAHSLYAADPKLGACLEIAEWPGGKGELEEVLFDEADCLTATGTDETLAALRQRLPAKTRFLGYGHRVSFGYVTKETLRSFSARKLAAHAAADVAAWDQLGCLSPHVIYVEHGGAVAAEQFAEMLAEELDRLEGAVPGGARSVQVAAAVTFRRGVYELRAAQSLGTKLWSSADSTAWTVVWEADPLFQTSCLHRFIYVKGATDLTEVLHAADRVRGQVSTVGLAASEERGEEIATELARWGVTRVCPLGRMQQPPLTWRHDGRLSLADLVTWTDWEGD